MNENIFNRAYRLLGTPAMEVLATKRVIVFGVGGVGSWCAESLVRTGIRHITLVDSDSVCETNINRQLMAQTTETVGQVKVEALEAQLLTINPEADIQTKHCFYNAGNRSRIQPFSLRLRCRRHRLTPRQSSPSAQRHPFIGPRILLHGSRPQVRPHPHPSCRVLASKRLPLGAALRRKFKKQQQFPSRKFKCVFSDELLANWAPPTNPSATKPKSTAAWHTSPPSLASPCAGLIIEHIVKRAHEAVNAAHSQTATPK